MLQQQHTLYIISILIILHYYTRLYNIILLLANLCGLLKLVLMIE